MTDRPGRPLPGSDAASRLLPSSVDRRTFLRGAALLGGAAVLAGCGGDDGGGSGAGATDSATASGGGGGDLGTVTVGSNYSDEVPQEAMAEVFNSFEQETGATVEVNTVDHNTYQEQINNYLQANPQDVFAWFAGFRMQFFAERNLASPISDVWDSIGDNYSEALREAATAEGEQYFVPFYYYPWAVFYRQSVFDERGYSVPETFDDFVALMEQMQDDDLVPMAFADQGGWPAMGTFDYLNLRINGYDYHKALMAGDESWDADQVREVFTTWRDILPYHQENALGRTWQEAAQTLANKEAGMYLLGMFVGDAMPDEAREDLDFFAFPSINDEYGQDTVEAPIDGWMLSQNPENPEGARELLQHLASAEAQMTYIEVTPTVIAANQSVDTSGYTPLQQKAVELIDTADHISQFMDRDTRPDFASTVMIPSLQAFLRNPDDVDGLVRSIEEQKQAIFET